MEKCLFAIAVKDNLLDSAGIEGSLCSLPSSTVQMVQTGLAEC